MKQLSFLLLLFFSTTLHAKSYYISASGNDAGDGLTTATAWQTLSKLNSSSFVSGDVILFRRGDSFYGSIIVPGSNLTFDAYGTGALPIITGYTTATSWINDGGGIYHTNISAASTSLINVTINGSLQRLGRYPNAGAANSGYLTCTAISSSTPSITGPASSSTTNWTGAEVVIRKEHWIIDRCRVTAHSGGTLSYTQPVGTDNTYYGKAGYGYFIQDDIRTLDQFGEWFLNKSTKALSVYFGSNTPSSYTIKVSTVDILFNCGGGSSGYTARSNTLVQNIAFEGANKMAFYAWDGTNITVKNCTLNNNSNGIYMWNVTNSLSDGNTITNTLNNGIKQLGRISTPTVITNNTVRNCGLYAGMAESGDGTNNGIFQDGNSSTIQYNRIDSIGYNGITFQGNSVTIANNYVTNFCMTKDDGGGLYTWSGGSTYTNRLVQSNIVINAVGAHDGTNGVASSHCIYLDGHAMNVSVLNNTMSQADGSGLFLNSGNNITATGNTMYNVLQAYLLNRMPGEPVLRNDIFTANICYPSTSNLFYWNGELNTPVVTDILSDMRAMFTRIDSNYYRNDLTAPFDWYYHLTNGGTFVDPAAQNFLQWPAYINGESHSKVLSTAANVFQYNASNSPIEYAFAGLSKKDAYGTVYNNSATIPAWSSKLLFDNGAAQGSNTAPVANAGADKVLTLPTNTATLSGSGTDANGTISSYAWVSISGPSTGTIATANAATTAINNLLQGVYKYELTVSDNNGAINKDTVQVTVNASANQLPVANAGADKVITLPTNTNTLSGSGTDANGTISSYAWVSISGPSTGTIATANAAATAINNLLQGVYKYELTVSDNNGAINKDTVQVTVNASANQPPVANAGADKNISLPTNTVTLDGVATDANGTISSYKWVKISGPAKGTIAKSNAASTSVNNLLQGIYQYQLSVTDNNGAIGKDTVQITINAAMNTLMNTLPVAKGGTDKTITLPINTVTLSGSGTDANGTISSYGWAKISGPATGAISKTSAATTDINSLLQGVYQYELTVTNNKGAKGKDTVQVIVNARLIEAPVVNAGVDKIITLPTNTITLEGRATDAKSAISSYAWVKISGPSTGTIATANEATTVVNNMVQGVYIFELSATNNLGASAKDTVQVKVNGVVVKNKLPTANAGADINIILPTDTAQITANAADADGTTTLYNWKVITGPTGYSIGNTNASHTTIKHLSEGVYDIELTVTNDHGDVAKDTLRLTVSAAIRLNYNAYSFQVYPNPVKDVANVKIAVNKGVSNAKVLLSVVNISGLVVKSKSLLTSGSSTIFKLDMADLIDGFYIIVLTFENGEKLTYKVVKHS